MLSKKADGCWNVPRGELFRTLEVVDAQATSYRLTPKQKPAGQRCTLRQLKLTQGTYNGPIYRANGTRCRAVHGNA